MHQISPRRNQAIQTAFDKIYERYKSEKQRCAHQLSTKDMCSAKLPSSKSDASNWNDATYFTDSNAFTSKSSVKSSPKSENIYQEYDEHSSKYPKVESPGNESDSNAFHPNSGNYRTRGETLSTHAKRPMSQEPAEVDDSNGETSGQTEPDCKRRLTEDPVPNSSSLPASSHTFPYSAAQLLPLPPVPLPVLPPNPLAPTNGPRRRGRRPNHVRLLMQQQQQQLALIESAYRQQADQLRYGWRKDDNTMGFCIQYKYPKTNVLAFRPGRTERAWQQVKNAPRIDLNELWAWHTRLARRSGMNSKPRNKETSRDAREPFLKRNIRAGRSMFS
ncbi:uncharacterized protein VTP21DRAFT_2087 [Calcarisporiella thermophila]|uniref:uncharacterized protein n=1 Tax=Calcarisporiella thermophila TaxID=911321 RepID=UPI00374252D5